MRCNGPEDWFVKEVAAAAATATVSLVPNGTIASLFFLLLDFLLSSVCCWWNDVSIHFKSKSSYSLSSSGFCKFSFNSLYLQSKSIILDFSYVLSYSIDGCKFIINELSVSVLSSTKYYK